MTDYELFKAFLDQSGVAHTHFDAPEFDMHGIEFAGEDRGNKVDGHGRLEVTFHPDGSLHDFCFWDTDR